MKEIFRHFHRLHGSKLLFLCITFISAAAAVSVDHHISDTADNHRKLLSYNGDPLAVEPGLEFENGRLKNAYIALQAWKEAILSDPNNMTSDWIGADVCNYTGVFCWPAIDNSNERTVAAIDINHGDMAGNLPHELGLLYDLALFHLNSNRFCGTIPQSFVNWNLLYELDLSNNRFAGKFPELLLQLPSLKYLDIRFNDFEGKIPNQLFEKDLDAIFINNNRFCFSLPEIIGKSAVSVIVLANNNLKGCIPASIGDMAETLNELILTNNDISSCLPSEIGKLKNLTVLDVSQNKIIGSLPDSIREMDNLEQLNIAHNMMSGKIGDPICELPNLMNFAYQYNFFLDESPACLKLPKFDDRKNCFKERPGQRTEVQCQRFLSRNLNCSNLNCDNNPKPVPLSPPPTSQSPPYSCSPQPPSSVSPPPPFITPPHPQPVPATPPAPVEIPPSPILPPKNPSPLPSNSPPPLCPCMQPPPHPLDPPSKV